MRLPLAIAVGLVLAASMPLYAQHGGGGHASAGGHGGFSSHGSFGGGSHAFSGAHSGSFAHGSSRPMIASRGFNSRSFNRNRGTGLRLRTYGLRNNCLGLRCGYGYPWGYGGFYDPYWWGDSGSSYDQDYQEQVGLANEMNQQSLDEQRMRQQQGDQGGYVRSTPPRHQEERTVAAPATVLIFRDRHREEVQNYAIVGETLWNFAPQHTEKISLDDLDIPATTKTNEDRGVDFRVPVTPGKLTLQIQSVD
jgi:hypothetical protein